MTGRGKLVLAVALGGVLGTLGSRFPAPPAAPARPATHALARRATAPVPRTTAHVMARTHFGCVTPELYAEAAALQGDDAAFQTRMLGRLLRGQCDVFTAGEPVVVTEVGIWSGLLKIRKPGEPQAFWTWVQAVD